MGTPFRLTLHVTHRARAAFGDPSTERLFMLGRECCFGKPYEIKPRFI